MEMNPKRPGKEGKMKHPRTLGEKNPLRGQTDVQKGHKKEKEKILPTEKIKKQRGLFIFLGKKIPRKSY